MYLKVVVLDQIGQMENVFLVVELYNCTTILKKLPHSGMITLRNLLIFLLVDFSNITSLFTAN